MILASSWNGGETGRCLAVAFVTLLLATPARAQLFDQYLPTEITGTGAEPDVTVASRARTINKYNGIRAGAYIIRPQLTESFGYETNVLAQKSARGSSLLRTNAALDASSDNSRGNVDAGLSVMDNEYFDLPNQSYTNWNVRLGGNYNIGRDNASVIFSHENQTQTQRDLDVPQINAPLAVAVDRVRLGYTTSFSRLSVSPEVEVGRYRFNSGLVNGAIYDQSYRNRVVVTPGVIASYELATRRNAVVIVRDTSASYSYRPAGSTTRDYNDTLVLAGLDYDLNGIVRARALVGYERRTFTSNAIKTIQAPIAEVTLIYNPTGLTTVTGTLSRRIQDSADETTAGVTVLSGMLKVDHELRRNIVIGVTGGISRNDYDTSGTGTQTLYVGGANATYYLNRHVAASATYDVTARNSSTTMVNFNGFTTGNNYVDHLFLLQLKLSL